MAVTRIVVESALQSLYPEREHVDFAGVTRATRWRRLQKNLALSGNRGAVLHAPGQLQNGRQIGKRNGSGREPPPGPAFDQHLLEFARTRRKRHRDPRDRTIPFDRGWHPAARSSGE